MRCIESVLNQTYKNIDIIIIDDGSNDGSSDILKKAQNTDNRIRLASQEHQGPAAARNKGVEISKGEYIVFIDADDYIEPNMIEVLYNLLESDNNDMAVCGYFKESTTSTSRIEGFEQQRFVGKSDICKYIKYSYVNDLLNPVWNKMYRKSMIKQMFDEDVVIGEDIDFNMRNLVECYSIGVTNKCLYHYNADNQSSISHTYDENVLLSLWDTDDKIEFYIRNIAEESDVSAIKEHTVKKTFVYLMLSCNKKVYKKLNPSLIRDNSIKAKLYNAFDCIPKKSIKMKLYKIITKSGFVHGIYMLNYIRGFMMVLKKIQRMI